MLKKFLDYIESLMFTQDQIKAMEYIQNNPNKIRVSSRGCIYRVEEKI